MVLAGALVSCAHFGRPALDRVSADTGCAALDSALSSCSLSRGLQMGGKTTIDVEQYRVRGRFRLELTPGGDVSFEMTSTTMLGGNREDAVFSFYADTLRVLDRERGNYYEGGEVDAVVADGLGQPIDLGELVRRATARAPLCGRLSELGRGNDGSSSVLGGRIDGESFELHFEGSHLVRAVWPLPRHDGRVRGTLEVTYRWRGGALEAMTLWVPEERWRIKLDAE